MQDLQPDTASHKPNESFYIALAKKVIQEAPECRESRITAAQRALNDHRLMFSADILASRIVADPLHQVHCDE